MGSCHSIFCAKNNSKSRERLLRLDDPNSMTKSSEKKEKKEKSLNDGAYFFDMFDAQLSTSKGPPIIPEVGPGR